MKNKVFISGSISIKNIPEKILPTLDKIIEQNLEVLIGDASGIDYEIKRYFNKKNYYNVTTYTVEDNKPRNPVSSKFKIKKVEIDEKEQKKGKERQRQQHKDIQMTKDSDYSFVIWDGKSKGSYNNIIRSLEQKKPIKVYLNNKNNFISKEEISITNINVIYSENNGYTATEVIEFILDKNQQKIFDKTQELIKYLLENSIIIKTDNIYRPENQYLNSEYFIDVYYKGSYKGIKYTESFINWIEDRIKKETKQLEPEQPGLGF